jgi:hypothetical protein
MSQHAEDDAKLFDQGWNFFFLKIRKNNFYLKKIR